MDGFEFPVEVVRTNRKKTVSIQLVGELVRVRVPRFLPDSEVRELLVRRTPWIQDKLREQASRPALRPKEYVSGEGFAYFGKNYRLKVVSGEVAPVELKDGYLVATAPDGERQQAMVKALLEHWYRHQAAVRLQEKTQRWSKIVGVSPASVSIRNYKSRWGTCSSKGDITYNWRIIAAPHYVVDYVVVHELCHMLELNHSPKYWSHVEKHMPDWRERRNWLRVNPIVF